MKLYPCPFCHSSDVGLKVKFGDELSPDRVFIQCKNCEASGPVTKVFNAHPTAACKAADAWNRDRKPSSWWRRLWSRSYGRRGGAGGSARASGNSIAIGGNGGDSK